MIVDIEETITIDRPRSEVAAYAMDPLHDTDWIDRLSRVDLITDPPVRVGTQVRRVAFFRVAAPLLAGRVRRGVHDDLQRLKRKLESGSGPSRQSGSGPSSRGLDS